MHKTIEPVFCRMIRIRNKKTPGLEVHIFPRHLQNLLCGRNESDSVWRQRKFHKKGLIFSNFSLDRAK